MSARVRADFRAKHWGVAADRVYSGRHPCLTSATVPELGKLLEIRVATYDRGRRSIKKIVPTQPAHLVYTTDKATRLFCVLLPRDTAELARDYAADALNPWEDLHEVNEAVGGRQAEWSYPHIPVKVLGRVHALVYHAYKGAYEDGEEEDGPSNYIHVMGTEGDEPPVKPVLCVDADGFLYLAGGSYVVEDRGIVN